MNNHCSVKHEDINGRKNIKDYYMSLLNHSIECVSCNSDFCEKMKNVLNHYKTCDKKPLGSCKTCIKMSNMLEYHALQCK